MVVGESGLARGGLPADPRAPTRRRDPRRPAARRVGHRRVPRGPVAGPDDQGADPDVVRRRRRVVRRDHGRRRRATSSSRSRATTSSTPSAGWRPGSRCWTRRSRRRCSNGCATARRPTRSWIALTEQEQRILDLIGQGMTNRQIAERMYLAEKTVKNYVSSLLAKLGLTSRTQAAIFAGQAHQGPGAVDGPPAPDPGRRGVRRPAPRGQAARMQVALDQRERLRAAAGRRGHHGDGPHARRRARAHRGGRRRPRRGPVRRARGAG